MLEVESLHAYYGKSHILQGVSLNVRAGEIVSILGRNGTLDAASISPSPRQTFRFAARGRTVTAAAAGFSETSTRIACIGFNLTTPRLHQGILPVDPQHQGGDNRK